MNWKERRRQSKRSNCCDDTLHLTDNLRREFIIDDELMSEIRQQGIEHLAEVKAAYLEGAGPASVMKVNGDTHPHHPKRHT